MSYFNLKPYIIFSVNRLLLQLYPVPGYICTVYIAL